MTLFVPRHGKGFVSTKDGAVELKKIPFLSITLLTRKGAQQGAASCARTWFYGGRSSSSSCGVAPHSPRG